MSGARTGNAHTAAPDQVDQIEQRVRGAFFRLALQVGGIVAEHPLQDEVVFTLCRCVDGAFQACLAPLADLRSADDAQRPPINLHKHPAVLHLLSVIETKSAGVTKSFSGTRQ